MTANLVRTWQHGKHELQDDHIYLELRGLFDHDYEYHLLFQQWDYNNPDEGWTYCLWFINSYADVSLVKRWPQQETGAPFLESATIIHEWMTMHGELQ